jgi:RyR domain
MHGTDYLHGIAKTCHEANKAWCEINGDWEQKDWAEAEEWQRNSAIEGVRWRLDNPGAAPDGQHNAWMQSKLADGWVYGEVKDADAKTHPCLVSFDRLPKYQQRKDRLFCSIVDALR